MRKELRNTMLILAALYILVGILMVAWPDIACKIACYMLGGALFVFGIVQTLRYFQAVRNEFLGGNMFVGLFLILIGLLVVIRAKAVVSVLVALMGVLVVADSIIKFVFARELRKANAPGWKAQMIAVLVLFLLGLFMLIDPFESVQAMIVCAGIFLLLDGIGNVVSVITASKFLEER